MVIDHGRAIAQGTADELKSQTGGERIEVVLADATHRDTAERVLGEVARGDLRIDESGRSLDVRVDDGAQALRRVLDGFDQQGIELLEVGLRRPTLDDVFLALTGHVAEVEDSGDEPAQTRTTEEVPA